MIHHLALEIDSASPLPTIVYNLVSPNGRTLNSCTDMNRAIEQRDTINARGGSIRIVERTTIIVEREIE